MHLIILAHSVEAVSIAVTTEVPSGQQATERFVTLGTHDERLEVVVFLILVHVHAQEFIGDHHGHIAQMVGEFVAHQADGVLQGIERRLPTQLHGVGIAAQAAAAIDGAFGHLQAAIPHGMPVDRHYVALCVVYIVVAV